MAETRQGGLVARVAAAPGAGSRADFSFAFRNPKFADSTLRVHVSHDATAYVQPAALSPEMPDSVSTTGRVEVKEVPVSTLVLVARSEYFRKMFTGSFSESASKANLDLHLSAEDEPRFMDLLFFMYSGALPEDVLCNFRHALQLLILADRFDVQDCSEECLRVLSSLLPEVEADDALLLLGLPSSLQQLPQFASVTATAKQRMVDTYSSLLGPPFELSFLRLPEACITALLESEDLEVETEDAVVEAAVAWICHNYSTAQVQADAIARLLLPRVRFQALSPKMILSLGLMLEAPSRKHLALLSKSLSREEANLQSSDEQPHEGSIDSGVTGSSEQSLDGNVASRVSGTLDGTLPSGDCSDNHAGSTAGLPDSALNVGCTELGTQVQLSSETATVAIRALTGALAECSEQSLILTGSIPSNKQLSSFLSGQEHRPPRKLCKPPFRIHLDIPLGRCEEWQPSNYYLASSGISFFSGKWFTVHAQVTPEDPSLGLYLSCDREATFTEGSPASFSVKCCFNVRTKLSSPAYQVAGTLRCTFDEEAVGWGLSNALNVGWERMLEEADVYFPDGALSLRADVWLLGDDN